MKDQIIEYISNSNFNDLKALLNDANVADISEAFDELSKEDIAVVYRLLPKDAAADVFARMENDTQELLIEILTDTEISSITKNLYVDDAVDAISEMPANLVKRILANTSPEKRKYINTILSYPDDSAGSIMTIEFVDLDEDMTVEVAIDRLRRIGKNKETIYTCYVTDNKRKLIGVITVKDLLLHKNDEIIKDIMEDSIISIGTHEDKEEVAKMFDKYDFLAMPVVDNENRLVGIVTIDDALDVMSEENEEDFEIMAAVSPSDDSYFKTSVFTHTKNRIVWLMLMMVSGIFTGSIINHYEEAFEYLPVLVSFIPMIMGTGGNCGSQASTMIIRGLATDEIELSDIFKVWFKEFRISLLVGVTLGIVDGIYIYFVERNLALSFVVATTLLCTVMIAKSLGCILPMLAKVLKLDPAIMASPMITTIVDATSIFIYFNVAMIALGL